MNKTIVYNWVKDNRIFLWNAGSLFGTTVVSSGLGFMYWWLAARLFPATMVGVASTSISAMMFLSAAAVLGLDTLLIGELSYRPEDAGPLITGSLLVTGILAGVLGVLFALIAPLLSPELIVLAQEPANVVLFAFGVCLTALSMVVDQALIGLLRGGLQLWRNIWFAVAKLAVLWGVSILLVELHGLNIYATWAIGNLLSLLVLLALVAGRDQRIIFRPNWSQLRDKVGLSLHHYGLNLLLRVPSQILPILATALLSATISATFFIAWMVATLAFVVPMHLSTVLYAVSGREPELLARKIRMTLGISFAAGLVSSSVLWVGADFIMGLFGADYAQEAAWTLRILGIAIFPMIIRFHYVALNRISRQVLSALRLIIGTSLLSLGLAAAGANYGGLAGMTLGWMIGICIEALLASITVYRAAVPTGVLIPLARALQPRS